MTSADHVCLLCMKETPLPHQYPCPFCGGDDRELPLQSPALPPRTVLGRRYLLGRTLGQGGFGITYHAFDLNQGKVVAVKEYFPSSLVGRDSSVSTFVTVNAVKGSRAQDDYVSGLRRFLEESRRQALLATSPGVVSVTDYLEENHTAYYIMEYVDGSTLVQLVQEPLPLAEVLELMNPIAESLVSIHEAGLIHRDISPDNIMCSHTGERKLLDFGASHSFTGDESTTGHATLKHGFAPPEQYGSSSMQGPWTDVYAFAATVYWCLTGKIPPDSMDRSIGGDKLIPPSRLGAELPPEAESVLLRGLALPVTARYQDMSAFWKKFCRAATGVGERLDVPTNRTPPKEIDPHGRTTRVTLVEKPEHTQVPPVVPRSVSKSEPTPLPAAEETPHEAAEGNDLFDEDITIYHPGTSRRRVAPLPEEPADTTDVTEKPHPRRVRMLAAALALLVVLGGAAFLASPLSPLRPAEIVDNETVTIGDNEISMDTTELYLTGDSSYESRFQPEGTVLEVSYLSRSDWKNLCQLTGLRKLALVSCSLTSLSGLETLTELEVLDVSGNSLSSLAGIESLENLAELYAADNALTSCETAEELTGLVYLDLSGNQISDLSPLSGLPRLSALYLRHNQVSDLSPLENISSLSALDLTYNRITSLTALSRLVRLESLEVDGNSVSNYQLALFASAQPGCQLDVEVLTDIPAEVTIGNESYSTSLTHLSLASHSLRDGDIDNLKYMVNLTELDISGNELSDFSCLSRLYNLTSLTISYNQVSDLSFLSGLIGLKTLWLSSNQITDLTPLSDLTGLENLAIGNNPLSDLTPLSNLTNLTMLAMCDCQVNSLEPICSLSSLVELRVSRGAYSQSALDGLKEAIPQLTINQY